LQVRGRNDVEPYAQAGLRKSAQPLSFTLGIKKGIHMGIMKWLARKGAVGSTARWAGNTYMSIHASNPNATLDEIMSQMVTARYRSPSDQHLRDSILTQVEKSQFSGLGALVVSILVYEAGFAENTAENRAMFADLINDELLKVGVPEQVLFDASRAVSALQNRLKK
jgi:hypothetical protein